MIEIDTLGSEINDGEEENVVSPFSLSLDAGREMWDLSPERFGMEEEDEEETSPSEGWFSVCPPLDALEKEGRKKGIWQVDKDQSQTMTIMKGFSSTRVREKEKDEESESERMKREKMDLF